MKSSVSYMTAAGDRVEDFLTRRIQHTNDTDEGHVDFNVAEFGGVRDVDVGALGWVVDGGQSQAAEGVATATVLLGDIHDLVVDLRGHGYFLGSDADVAAAIQDTFRGTFAEDLGSAAQTGGLQRHAHRRHRFTIAREFKSELFLPFGVHVLADDDGGVTAVQTDFADVVWVHLLTQGDEGRFGSFTDLLEGLFELVEIDGRVVAHHADGSNFVKSVVVTATDLAAVHRHFSDGLVGRSADFELVEEWSAIVINFVDNEHAADRHLIGGECSSFIGADDRGATQSLDRGQRADNGVLLGHTAGAQSQAGGDDGRKTFRDGGHSQGDGDFEVVDSAFNPGSTVSGIVKVSDVDGPYSDANDRNDFRQLFTELVQFLLQGCLDLFSLRHLRSDLTDGRVQTGADDDTAGLSGSNVSSGEEDVFLVLVDSAWVGYGLSVFDH